MAKSIAVAGRVAQRIAGTIPSSSRVSVARELAAGFIDDGRSPHAAEELAERWLARCEAALDQELRFAFDAIGVPRTLVESPREGVYFTLLHPRYEALLVRPLPSHFAEVYEKFTNADQKELLALSAAVLVLLGCEPVYITDGTGDGGVDVAGRISTKPGHGLLILVQAKAYGQPIPQRLLHEEHGVLVAALRDGRLAHLMDTLSKGTSDRTGRAAVYAFTTTKGFSSSAERGATLSGILLQHPMQMAFWLSRCYGPDCFDEIISTCDPIKRDLDRDLSKPLHSLMKVAFPV